MFSVLAALVTLGGLVNAQGYVTLPFTKETVNNNFSKREVVGGLARESKAYTVDFSIGKQKQMGYVDTSTTELWVYGIKSAIDIIYDPSGAELSSNKFDMSYGDGTKADGQFYKDKLTLGGVAVDAEFGVVDRYDSTSRYGKVGLGLLKTTGGCINPAITHNSLPFLLKDAGQIEAAAYSLNLNPRDDRTGNVVFGAVDKTRYTGKFQMLNGESDDHFAVNFSINCSSIIGALDSANSYTYLPDDITSSLAASMGAAWSDDSQYYRLPWDYTKQDLVFDFSGTKITMPESELVKFSEDAPWGMLMVMPASQNNGRIVLGDSFLRSAYTVYDLENNRVAIAQASGYNGAPDYEAITSAGIPGAVY